MSLVRPKTLFSRLVSIISGLTFTIVLLFTAATLLITYSFEDVLFNERLQQAHAKLKNGEALPYNIQLIDALDELEPDLLQKLRYFELGQSEQYGEFSVGQRHYHYLVIEDGTILYDTTDVALVDRALEDVFLILAVLLIPTIFLTFWVAKLSARYALIPFSQLSQLFVDEQQGGNQDADRDLAYQTELLDSIKEQDVKHIALELQNALKQKAEVLEQQVVFNQGMAHELRTPLQVMRNSSELLRASQPDVSQSAAFLRLEKSISRMRRLSNGLLWLTSEQEFNDQIDVATLIQGVIEQLKDQCQAHEIQIDLTIKQPLTVQIPDDVMELIVFNLFNNVVNHGLAKNIGIIWTIVVDSYEVVFLNSAATEAEGSGQGENFGIGLSLVSRLAQRFNLNTSYQTQNGLFSATLSVNQSS